MKEYIKKHRTEIIFALINIFVFIIMFAINSIYPLCWDDNGVVKDFDVNNWGFIDVLKHSYYRYYLHWSGKFVSLTLANFFTLLNKSVYNIVNSMLYVVFANVIYRFCWKEKNNYWILAAIYATLWICIPWYGTVVFWIDGTIEYLWMLIPILLYGSVYYNNYFGYTESSHSCVGMFLLGLLAGCGLEATGSALIFGLGVMVIAKRYRGIKIDKWEIFGIVGALIGFATLMLAPGNYSRVDAISEISTVYSNVFYRFARESFFTVLYMFPLIGVVIALMLVLYKSNLSVQSEIGLKNKLASFYSVCREQIVLIAIALVSIYVMTFVSAFAARIFLTPTVLLIIAGGGTIRMLCDTDVGNRIMHDYGTAIKVLIVFVCIFVLSQMFMAYLLCLFSGEPITKNIQYINALNDVRLL